MIDKDTMEVGLALLTPIYAMGFFLSFQVAKSAQIISDCKACRKSVGK